jgi:hypothetical protein
MDMPGVWILSGLVGATLFLATYLWGRRAEGSSTTITLGTPTVSPDCDAACSDFELRRQERCRAKFAEAAAKTELDARDSDFKAAAVALATATAAAFGSATFPWPVNLIVGIILWTIVTVLLAMMMFFLGKKLVSSDAWATASAILAMANNAVLDARNVVRAKCPADRADKVLFSPDAC